jgi:hypothetical protein
MHAGRGCDDAESSHSSFFAQQARERNRPNNFIIN